MPDSPFAIEVQHVSKSFRQLQALKDVSFNVPRGGVFCILGPNGAGKSTLLRILTTITHPTAGNAFIEGFNIMTQTLSVREQIGVVAQDNHFDQYLSVWHNLTIHAQMHGIPKKVYEARIAELLQVARLYDRRFSMTDELSGGMRRRIILIRALIHEPRILFLDEPTTGLDPQARLEIWETIEAFKQHATVVLTTHYMDEADRLSDRILLLSKGQVVSEGTPYELKHALATANKFELVLNRPAAQVYREQLSQHLREDGLPDEVTQLHVLNEFTLNFCLPDPGKLSAVFHRIEPADLHRIGQVEVALEEVFMSIANEPAGPRQEAG